MLNERMQAEWDQHAAEVGEIYPMLLSNMYRGMRNNGFSPAQSMDLIRTYFQQKLQHDAMWHEPDDNSFYDEEDTEDGNC